MKNLEELLQERLERLEAGEALEACLADLPEDEADLLRMAAMLRKVQYPERAPEVVADQRANVLKLAAEEKKVHNRLSHRVDKALERFRLPRLLPLAVSLGAVAFLFVCVLVVLIGAGFVWRSYQGAQLAQDSLPSSTSVIVAPSPIPSPTLGVVVQDVSPSPTLTPEESPAEDLPPGPAEESTHAVFLPLVSLPEFQNPQVAVLKEPQGLVQVQADDGTWTAVGEGRRIATGQRIRTGALSSVEIAFYDGSRARLGANTEVSVDELDARTAGGPRVVALTQWIGETDHDVASASSAGSRYEVRTPSGSGQAKGTSFHVVVTSVQLSRFIVEEGSVAVTGLNVTVIVLAGQSTTISPGEPPSEPVFRITGQGEVTATGATWTIGEQTFETDENTVIVGNPQAGDWVFVEGRLLPGGVHLAERIVLLRRAQENRFTIIGRVETISDTTWTVAGQVIVVDDETTVEEDIESDDLVRVEGVILEGGTLLAEHIYLLEEETGWPFHFVGVVQDIAIETWTVSGVTVTISDTTEIDEGLLVGDVVEVQGWILDDDIWLAQSIERVEEEEREFEFTGYVESIDPWVVSGIAFTTTNWTEIEAGIEVGDHVKVEGRIEEDGTWVASEIERLDDDDDGLHVVFVGTVMSQDPWIVSGIPLVVADETVIVGDVDVGDLVRVRARILPGGTWLAEKIRRIGGWPGRGCFSFSAVVVSIDGGWLTLFDGQTIDLGDGVAVEGELGVDSIVLIFICIDADGAVTVVSIIVIYQPGPIIIILPPSPPPGDGDGDKVTICHKSGSKNEHTITVSRSSLQSHLDHGDTIGPCQDHDDDDDD